MPASGHAQNVSDEAQRVALRRAAMTASRAFAAVGVGVAVIGAVSTALVHLADLSRDLDATIHAAIAPRSVDIWLRGSR
jgi:precorrin isomerase